MNGELPPPRPARRTRPRRWLRAALLSASAALGVWTVSSSEAGEPTSGPRFRSIELIQPALP